MKKQTIAQQAGVIRRKYKRLGIETIRDHNENDVPLDYVPNIKLVEHAATQDLIQEAKAILQTIREFKHKVQTTGDEIYNQLLAEEGLQGKEVKNFHIGTFNKNKKVVYKRPPKYTQDEKELAISREYKKKWLKDEADNAVPDYIIDLVTSLIESRDGNIDQAQISELNKMTEKIRNKNFREMVKHFNKSLEPYYAKRYEQFVERDAQGEDQNYVLTYSSAEPCTPEEDN